MWRHDGNPEQDRLNAYWDAAVGGASPEALAQAAPDLDPNLLDTVTRARLLHRRNRPDPAFAVHLESVLMNAFATTYPKSTEIHPAHPKRLVTRPTWLPRRGEIFPRKWSLAAVATIALIAITLAAFFFSMRNSHHPAFVPGTPVTAPTSTPAPSPTAVPVTMYRGNLERTGVMPGPAPAGRPGVLWQAQVDAVVNGAMAVGNGLVYAGTDDGSVHAFDAITGAEVWSMKGHTFESPSIVLDGATAYVSGYDGMVLAVDAATGAELWRTDPALNVGRRVAFDSESKTLYVGGIDPITYALDSTNGALKWQADTSGPMKSVATIVAGDTLYFGTGDGLLYALNTADGSTRWTWDSQFDLVRSLTYANGTIFGPATSTADFAFVAIDASTGTERWRLTSAEGEYAAASVVGGNVIIGTAFGEVMSVSQTDGQVNWTFAPDTGGGFAGPSGIVGNNVYVTDSEGSLYALDLATGQELWWVKLDGGDNHDPVITGGVIYLGTLEGSVYALGDGGAELPVATPVAAAATPAASPVASSPPAAVEADVELLWAKDGGDGGFAGASTMAIAPDGSIWVADTGNHRFLIFDPDGTFRESWTGTGPGEFRFMRANGDAFNAITFAADGSFYVLDPYNRRIQAFAADRTFLRSIGGPGREAGQFLEPIDVVIDPAGNLAVLDDVRVDIQTFAPDGTLVATALLPAAVPSGPNMNALAIDADGNFYVAELSEDSLRRRVVEKFDPQGNLVQQYGLAPGPGKLIDHPLCIAVDAAGIVYVTENEGNPRVLVFTPNGDYLTEFGGPGSPAFAFQVPGGIALDGQGNVYVTDWSQNRLVKLRLPQSLGTPAP